MEQHPDRKIQRHGDGVYSKWHPRLFGQGKGGWVYYVQYYWNGKRITERSPATRKKGRVAHRLEDARALKAKREREKRDPAFVPLRIATKRETERRERDARVAAEEIDARRRLLFDIASERFLSECGDQYSRRREVELVFRNRLALAFEGRHLDTITRAEVRQYYLDRMANVGPFLKLKRAISVRTPQKEITFLSALYTWLADGGETLDNPCHRPRTRRRDSPLAPYRPAHQTVVPKAEALRAIFTATAKGEDGRETIGDTHRALWLLCYYTAARPESEPCRLTHGDVEFGDGDRWGSVTYRRTKTGVDRTIPMHPDVAAALRAIMLAVPMRKAARIEWRRTPIFRKRRTRRDEARPEPWSKNSYRKAWANTIAAVSGDHPEVAGLWLRDLRKAAKTRLVEARVPAVVIDHTLGHSPDVKGTYFLPTHAELQRALTNLDVSPAAVVAANDREVRDAV